MLLTGIDSHLPPEVFHLLETGVYQGVIVSWYVNSVILSLHLLILVAFYFLCGYSA